VLQALRIAAATNAKWQPVDVRVSQLKRLRAINIRLRGILMVSGPPRAHSMTRLRLALLRYPAYLAGRLTG
jgi:hypothetical protein